MTIRDNCSKLLHLSNLSDSTQSYNMGFPESFSPQARNQIYPPINSYSLLSPKPYSPHQYYPRLPFSPVAQGLMQSTAQPSRLSNVSYPYYSYYHNYIPEGRSPSQFLDQYNIPAQEIIDGYHHVCEEVDEIIEQIFNLYEKLPASIRDEVILKMMMKRARPTSEQNYLNVGYGGSSRDVRGPHGLVDDLSQRLERFMIKTINVGGIVKEEEDKK